MTKHPKSYEAVNILRWALYDTIEGVRVIGKNMRLGSLTISIDDDLYDLKITPIRSGSRKRPEEDE